ncbi:UDP-2,4-diacetamido-2,4,6-trideoxy-beta-L-altropyranose hydrolase [Methylobacterium sp. PvR107]|uniref:UDP-2,4-diacetamido-2,4, 6-trideoxy-beta-L-altropyranose hydrolase n=1 Tax=Methylobacterium sp. PvR107 TaxID=2806597 RepID=UPI001AE4B9DD|nr:UDP-2,4-diacetamido-2,4,6-trideoxy-beta-L-altropyranose hydrolase [Methylobacterium sp. PvR107]
MTRQGRLAVFRADGNKSIGGGHILRCRTVADELARRGWRVALATDAQTTAHLGAWAVWPEMLVVEQSGGPSPEDCARRWPDGCDLLVTDHYSLDIKFETACRPWANFLFVIDDLGDRAHNCNLLLDQTLGISSDAYLNLVPDGSRLLIGPTFALIRPDFVKLRAASIKQRRLAPNFRRLLIALGLADNGLLLECLVEAISESDPTLSIDVVTGDARTSTSRKGRVTWHGRVGDMASLMATADLGLGAAGTSTWERCCLGLPSLMVILASNQEAIAQAIERAGAGLSLGPANEGLAGRAAAALQHLRSADTSLRTMSRRAAAICDGKGVQRVANAVEALYCDN